MKIRHNWTFDEIEALYTLPLLPLISKAHEIHGQFHTIGEVQVAQLISVKTGGCPEDCKYCAQSSRYRTSVKAEPMMSLEEVVQRAKRAIATGATRICLGAAWREVRDSKQFEDLLAMVHALKKLGVEVCCTLGMIKAAQLRQLKEAGLHAYSHNLDSSERFYKTIISTRTYQDRLDTLDLLEEADINVCCGAILGMGEEPRDRLEFLHTLARRNPHPESTPLNRLIPIEGTPLGEHEPLPIWELLRMIAVARIVLPKTTLRLSAGRKGLSFQDQALCFMAGANSIHAGETLLTAPNVGDDTDSVMFETLGLKRRAAFTQNYTEHSCCT